MLQLSPRVQVGARCSGYPENTAGRSMTPKYAWIYPDMTAAEALDKSGHTGRKENPQLDIRHRCRWQAGGRSPSMRISARPAQSNVHGDRRSQRVVRCGPRDAVTRPKAFEKYAVGGVLPVTDDRGYIVASSPWTTCSTHRGSRRCYEDIQKLARIGGTRRVVLE